MWICSDLILWDYTKYVVIELMWTVRFISLHKKYQLGDLNEVENKKDEKIKETWVWKNWKGSFFCGNHGEEGLSCKKCVSKLYTQGQ